MRTRANPGWVPIIILAFTLCGCRWAEGFTVVLPDREIKVTIPDTGAKIPKVELGLSDRDLVRGSGELVTVERNVHDFDQISIMGSGEVTIIQGDEESLCVTIEDNLLDYLAVEVNAGILTLGWDDEVAKDKDLHPSQPIRYEIVVKKLSRMSIYGSADVISDELGSGRLALEIFGSGDVYVGTIETDRMAIEIFGVGHVNIENLMAEDLKVGIFGMGDVEVAGRVVDQEVRIPGKGDYRADQLHSEFASVFIAGSGEATLWVTERIQGEIDGIGHLKYYGDPELFFSGAGSRDLISLGEK